MNPNYIGYACINETLSKLNIRANRNIKKDTFITKGVIHVSDLIQKNLNDLLTILKWNIEHDIYNYRIPSEIFPWKTEYNILDLPNYIIITQQLKNLGDFIITNDIRVSFHPDHFCILSSPNSNIVNNSIKELESLNSIFDLMELPQTSKYKINIHVGGVYGDKIESTKRFCQAYLNLSPSLKKRLTVENDDNKNGYTVKDLYYNVYQKIQVPVVFDYYHHSLNNGGLSERDALDLCISTWDKKIIPMVHYSSSKKLHEDSLVKSTAHADFIYEKIETYGHDLAIMLETKSKEKSVIKYKENML